MCDGSTVKKVNHKLQYHCYLYLPGTFKIESSHHLARFWGQRKNRSQMNYDKLSRSLRQYYKKGTPIVPSEKMADFQESFKSLRRSNAWCTSSCRRITCEWQPDGSALCFNLPNRYHSSISPKLMEAISVIVGPGGPNSCRAWRASVCFSLSASGYPVGLYWPLSLYQQIYFMYCSL